MGVPTFFRWVCVRYPKTLRDTIEREPVEMDGRMVPVDLDEDAPNGDFDNMYLDMNGIIHPCCHPEDGPAPEDEEHMYENIFLYLDRLIRIVRPKKMLYMAIDGVAPRAKMNQQRARRFRAAQEREEMDREQEKLRADWEAEGKTLPNRSSTKFFDSNVITPGTNFLHKMSEAIRYYIHDRTTNDPLWQKLRFRVILSDANIPAEGEHKILQWLRLQRGQPDYDPNVRHCLYGADADLIMLGLATHEAHFSIIREVVVPKTEKKCSLCGGNGHVASECTGEGEEMDDPGVQKPFQIISIPILRQYLGLQFAELEDRMPADCPYDFERCIDDFVFMCFFVGNDFLPHLPSLSIRDGSIDQMISLYIEILPSMGDYMSDCGKANLAQAEQFIEYLGGIEDQVFKNQLERESKKRSEMDNTRELDDGKGKGKGKDGKKGKGKDEEPGKMGGELGGERKRKAEEDSLAKATTTTEWHDQLVSAFSSNLEEDLNAGETGASSLEPPKQPEKPKSGKFVAKEFHAELRERLNSRQDLGEAMADTVRLGEGPHWKQRYYFEKFKVKQDDLVDFLQRIRKAYVEGLCWVLVYYYQGCPSWTWFYPYHYAPFASDLIGCSTLKCGEITYFHHGIPFMPFQQLMSVLPPCSANEAGIPAAMQELMNQPFSPLVDFYPADFGLDLNGKRFTWQAVILLPFIDEPRLVRILAPLLKRLVAGEKVRNRRGQEIVFGHRDDKIYMQNVLRAQAEFDAGRTSVKFPVKGDKNLFGSMEGWVSGGANRHIESPIEGLPDVEESHCVSVLFTDPEGVPHTSKLLPGITEMPIVISAGDMDEANRLKGFGGEPAKRMIMQALGKDPDRKPTYKAANARKTKPEPQVKMGEVKSNQQERPAAQRSMAAPVAPADAGGDEWEYEEDESEFADPLEAVKVCPAPAPPVGARVIRVRPSERPTKAARK